MLVYEDYHSAYNAVVQPDKYVTCARYFIACWMPRLGGVGTQIVLALRSLGFYNPRTGERRGGIVIELPELADLCGISVSTLKREFGSKKGWHTYQPPLAPLRATRASCSPGHDWPHHPHPGRLRHQNG